MTFCNIALHKHKIRRYRKLFRSFYIFGLGEDKTAIDPLPIPVCDWIHRNFNCNYIADPTFPHLYSAKSVMFMAEAYRRAHKWNWKNEKVLYWSTEQIFRYCCRINMCHLLFFVPFDPKDLLGRFDDWRKHLTLQVLTAINCENSDSVAY